MMLNWDYSYFPEKTTFKTYFNNVFIRPNTDYKPFDTQICVGGEYKVLEFNCINCSCTYAADVEAIIANL